MQQTIGRLAALVLSVALLAGLGVSPATAKSIDQGCETDAMRHDSVSDELCATEDSPIDDSRAAKSETKSTRDIEPRNVDPVPRPIRTITEGQSTTFTVPTPVNRQTLRCVTAGAGGVGFVHPTASGVTRPNDEPLTCGSGTSRTDYGLCLGPYTVEITRVDDRLSNQPSGQRIRVTTNAQDDTNDAGTLTIPYMLHGTRTQTTYPESADPVTTRGVECTLVYETPVTVKINPARRPGMTAAVALHAPSREYLSTPSTSTWTCTQAVIDAGVQCSLNDVISTTTQPTFPTPRRCVVIVTVASNGKGFGSTNCLPRSQAPAGWDNLPACPLSTHTDDMNALPVDSSDRKRCVARN